MKALSLFFLSFLLLILNSSCQHNATIYVDLYHPPRDLDSGYTVIEMSTTAIGLKPVIVELRDKIGVEFRRNRTLSESKYKSADDALKQLLSYYTSFPSDKALSPIRDQLQGINELVDEYRQEYEKEQTKFWCNKTTVPLIYALFVFAMEVYDISREIDLIFNSPELKEYLDVLKTSGLNIYHPLSKVMNPLLNTQEGYIFGETRIPSLFDRAIESAADPVLDQRWEKVNKINVRVGYYLLDNEQVLIAKDELGNWVARDISDSGALRRYYEGFRQGFPSDSRLNEEDYLPILGPDRSTPIGSLRADIEMAAMSLWRKLHSSVEGFESEVCRRLALNATTQKSISKLAQIISQEAKEGEKKFLNRRMGHGYGVYSVDLNHIILASKALNERFSERETAIKLKMLDLNVSDDTNKEELRAATQKIVAEYFLEQRKEIRQSLKIFSQQINFALDAIHNSSKKEHSFPSQ